jgi:chitin deacetylase
MHFFTLRLSAWSSAYPTWTPDLTMTPQSWTDAYNAANQAGLIPNIPPTTVNSQGQINYPSGYNALSIDVCNAYAGCRIPGDTYNAPDGSIGIGSVFSYLSHL